MTYAFFSLADRFARLRARQIAPIEKRTRVAGFVRANPILRGVRTNPEFHDNRNAVSMLDRFTTALQNRRVRRRWQRDLQTMDDRLLRDIGVARADAEQAIRRLRIWICNRACRACS